MNELALKYGCNPNQTPARVYADGGLPFTVLNGRPGYINLLDALNSWQLVRELRDMAGIPAAASFKHVSPAGAALGLPLEDALARACHVGGRSLSPVAAAYARARGADRMSSYGDFAAVSDICDESLAEFLRGEVSDGIIAPGYTAGALGILKSKRKGSYLVLQMDENYTPPAVEHKDVYGVTFEQRRNDVRITEDCLTDIPTANKDIPADARRDLLLALITLKYTQSNSVCYASGGQAIGVGAGQQSRVHCTRLAGSKADTWHLRQSPQALSLPFRSDVRRPDRDNAIDVYITGDAEDYAQLAADWRRLFTAKPAPFTAEEKRAYLKTVGGVSLGSDAFFPFGDNIERAHRSGVSYIAQSGGSIRDDNVIETCDKYGIAMAMTHIRLFHH
ncbi:phosphoribosylaminoimidazolecarboxamide formyltransferase [Selenomonas sp. F0473]|uniref:phosphoribosylaminoimidazolecarboxamide formyltransferase n=1 Tax=Selenomonas sp. F0473 TaxID=999423 RepID=UPI0025DB4516|nr:phosphoribosylaminoimidazolecarboxamide formyltransferase [Selenomonas sp. F0473]